jgi:NitT/TauT family transport system substrate-binding protein
MSKTKLRVGHLQIIDHLILGITKRKPLEKVELELIPKVGWNEIGDALKADELDVAFMLAPFAMDLFYSQKKYQAAAFKPS